MSKPRGTLQVIRSSYRLHGSHGTWSSRLAADLAKVASTREGSLSFRFRVASQCLHPWELTLEPPYAREYVNMLLELCAHASSTLRSRLPDLRTWCGSLSETGLLDIPEVARSLRDRLKDSINFIVFEPDDEGCAFLFPATETKRLHEQTRRSWQRLLVHLAAGFRLRRLSAAEILDAVASVLGSAERQELAAMFAQDTWSVRDVLRRIALSVDQALACRGHSGDALAQEVFQGAFAGRWTLIDHFLHGERRFVIARRVEAEASTPLRLTQAELEVVRHAMESSGDNHEGIARAMQKTRSYVSNHLMRALHKLGVRNRTELIAALRVRLKP